MYRLMEGNSYNSCMLHLLTCGQYHRGGSHRLADASNQAADTYAGHSGAAARQGVSAEQIAGPGSKTPYQYLQGAECRARVESCAP